MIYIIFTMAIIINIFNILLIANNKIYQNIKEKALLVTYSIAELIYLIFILSLIEYTAGSTVFVISFISIWLLAKAYICVINMNFNDNGDEIISMDNRDEQVVNAINSNQEFVENSIEENEAGLKASDSTIEDIEIIREVPEDKLEDNEVAESQDEKIELSDLFEDAQANVETPTALYDLDNIVESARRNKEEERRIRRRSLALRTSQIMNKEK